MLFAFFKSLPLLYSVPLQHQLVQLGIRVPKQALMMNRMPGMYVIAWNPLSCTGALWMESVDIQDVDNTLCQHYT